MIVLYTIGCPACNVLESKLKQKGINYDVNTSEESIRQLGFDHAPLLQVADKVMDFAQALQYLAAI